MALISVRAYARARGVTHQAVRKRTVLAGGPIPVHGPQKQIDPEEADRLWAATMTPHGADTSRFQGPGAVGQGNGQGLRHGLLVDAPALTQARTALLLTETQLRRLRLDERRCQLLNRQATLAHFLATMHAIRDAFLGWPARVGPELAADLGVDATKVMIALEPYVRRQLEELADVRLDIGAAVRR